MDKRKIYTLLEAQENGTEMIQFLKGEFGKVDNLEANLRTTNSDKEKLEAAINEAKPLMDYIGSNNLNLDRIKGFVTKSREGESEFQRQLREIGEELTSVKGQLSTEVETRKVAEQKAQDLEAASRNGDLKKAFSTKLTNVIPDILDEHLTNRLNSGDLRYDSENRPIIKVDEKMMSPESYSEYYTAKYPNLLITKGGPGSTPPKGVPQGQLQGTSLLEKSPSELLAMRYEQK